MVDRCGFGTWPLGGRAYGPVDEESAARALEAALDAGIRLFDTADIYGDGRIEQLLGQVVGGVPDAVIVTKVGYLHEAGDAQDFSALRVARAVEGALGRLRRARIDVLLLHSPPREILRDAQLLATLDALRTAGVVERTGVSLRSVEDFRSALAWPGCAVVEVILNLLDQRAVDLGLVAAAHAQGVEILARLPLCSGLLGGRHRRGATFPAHDRRGAWPRAQLDAWLDAAARFRFLEGPRRSPAQGALSFCRTFPGVCPIPGMKTPAHVHEAAAAGTLDDREMREVREVWASLTHLPPVARVGLVAPR